MSTSPNERDSTRHNGDPSAYDIEAVANELLGLFDEFEAEISRGRVPRAFAERLAEIRQTAEGLIDP